MFQEVEKCRRNRAEQFAPVCGIRRQVAVRESNAGSQPPYAASSLFSCGSVILYRVMSTQLPSPRSVGRMSVSCSGEMHVPFTAKVPLQMLNRELSWPFHFCYHRVKTIPGRQTAQANEGEKEFSSR